MIVVIGLDAATWKVITPNLNKLPNIKKLMDEGNHKTIKLDTKPHSAQVWCSMFCGKPPSEHKHENFVVDGKLRTREDIKVDFLWDVLDEAGVDIKALNVPFVYPPYNFKCGYKAVGYGLSTDLGELELDTEQLTEKAKEILKQRPEVFIVVYTMLDKIQHFHWGEDLVLDWYKKMDEKIGELLYYVRDKDNIILISDHGFCDWDEVENHTLPPETPEGKIKGDHHEEAILITKNISYEIDKPEDVFYAIKNEFSKNLNLEEKILKSKKVIRQAFEKFERIGIAWTTGKDSTVVLGLLKEIFGNIPVPVIFGDTTVHFQEVYKFRDKISREWNLDLKIAKPKIPKGFEIGKDRENCCHLLKTVPAQEKIGELGLDAVIVGIRWDEQKARENETYFSKRKNHRRVHPILHWSEKDVWDYMKDRKIPHNPLYDKGFRSIGCKLCTKPTPSGGEERAGRSQDKEKIMERLRAMGYW